MAKLATKGGASRRGFIAAVGAAAAATAVPSIASAASGTRWADVRGGLPALRAAYLAEVARFAETLRPRFEAGELFGWDSANDPDDTEDHPVTTIDQEVEGWVPDDATGYLVLACSPAEAQSIDGGGGIADIRSLATDCIVIDAFRHARERGWWKPGPGEYIGLDEWNAKREVRS